MKQRLLYLLRFYVLTVLLFIAAKVVFMLCNAGGHGITVGDYLSVVAHGLSLDLSTALYFLIVPLLCMVVSVWVRLPRWVLKAYCALLAVAFALAFVADTSLYEFWGFKLDASCLQYLEQPEGITASVSTGYLVVRFVVWAAVAAAIYWLYRSYRNYRDYRNYGKKALLETALYVLLMPLMVLGLRGGVHESTTNIGQVYYSQNQFLNHAAVNPVFSFLYSLSHQLGDQSQYNFFEPAECEQLVSSVYTTESHLADTLLTTTRPDVVIILLESAGEEFAAAMPRLQQLKTEGVCFSRCYANSWRTDRGTVCVLSGYPSFPSVSVMKMPERSRSLPSIARTLQREGYQTSYLYGGDINFTNMRSYLISTGWATLTSMDDYTASQRATARWGVRDDLTFRTLYEQIAGKPGKTGTSGKSGEPGKSAVPGGTDTPSPRLFGYSTLSSHEPWDVPTHTIDGDKVLNAFSYLDSCLGNFVDSLRQTPAWQNLLIVITADHGINYKDITQAAPLQKNHIPMLWIGGAVKRACTIDAICNQTDLAATLLGQMQLPHHDFRFSRDVLSHTYRHPTAVNNYNNAQWIVDSTGHVLYDFDARQIIVSEGDETDRLLRLSKAVLQVTTTDLTNR